MKLGHYMKVPPRTMFLCQVVATVVAGTTQLGVQHWYVPCLTESNELNDDDSSAGCSPTLRISALSSRAISGSSCYVALNTCSQLPCPSFICPTTEVFFVASVVWGKYFWLRLPQRSASALLFYYSRCNWPQAAVFTRTNIPVRDVSSTLHVVTDECIVVYFH
jgi:hypothetical protein